jgi:serine/threonine protein kinase
LRLFEEASDGDPKALQRTLEIFNYEVAICEQCNGKQMSRVSKMVEHGTEKFAGYALPIVHYLIFEKADGDSRDHAVFAKSIEYAWKLRSLHNIATGLKQLHSIEVSHQDLKPSNIFVFGGTVSKVGDLGRAMSRNLEAEHSKNHYSGDGRYAPPEAVYRYILPDWKTRVFAIDCYLLGSMIPYYFIGANATSLLYHSAGPDIDLSPEAMSFEDALPYLVNAFDTSCRILEAAVVGMNTKHVQELMKAFRYLCHPDPQERGHPLTRQEVGHPLLLQRIETIFNRLAWESEQALSNG